jgi:hypothetical protein
MISLQSLSRGLFFTSGHPNAGRTAIHPIRSSRAPAHLAAPPCPKLRLRRSGAAPAISLSPASGRIFSGAGTPPTPNRKIACFLHCLRRGQPRCQVLRGASRRAAIMEEGGRRGGEGDTILHDLDAPDQRWKILPSPKLFLSLLRNSKTDISFAWLILATFSMYLHYGCCCVAILGLWSWPKCCMVFDLISL